MTYEKPVNRFCVVFGHNYRHLAQLDEETSELVCKCCGNHFISTISGNILNLSAFGEMFPFSNYLKKKH